VNPDGTIQRGYRSASTGISVFAFIVAGEGTEILLSVTSKNHMQRYYEHKGAKYPSEYFGINFSCCQCTNGRTKEKPQS